MSGIVILRSVFSLVERVFTWVIKRTIRQECFNFVGCGLANSDEKGWKKVDRQKGFESIWIKSLERKIQATPIYFVVWKSIKLCQAKLDFFVSCRIREDALSWCFCTRTFGRKNWPTRSKNSGNYGMKYYIKCLNLSTYWKKCIFWKILDTYSLMKD